MNHLYNEIDSNAAAWLENLTLLGEIPLGRIDTRPIQQLGSADLAGVRQFHTFAGIGGWPLALRLAGWPSEREVWTGSCPCQPFSSAGKGKGVEDERHLWPEFFRLIKECRPATVFGEQVGSKAGIGWLDGVQADLEGEGYTCGAIIMGAHSIGAPHIRQIIYWVAHRDDGRRLSGHGEAEGARGEVGIRDRAIARDSGEVDGLADGFGVSGSGRPARNESGPQSHLTGSGPWSDYRIIPCTDGKFRRTGSEVFPLAYGLPRSVGKLGPELERVAGLAGLSKESLRKGKSHRIASLKGYGNAIVPVLAAEFVMAFMESESALGREGKS